MVKDKTSFSSLWHTNERKAEVNVYVALCCNNLYFWHWKITALVS